MLRRIETLALAHLRHHLRFYGAALLGFACYLAMPLAEPARLLAAGDLFFAGYLGAMAVVTLTFDAAALQARASEADEGIAVVVLLVLGAIAFCLSAVFTVLSQKAAHGPLPAALAIAAVPLGWLTLHTVAAYHYANLFYAPAPEGAGPRLLFPSCDRPGPWDFLYFSMVIGMTAQVSDVQVADTAMRRASLGHSVVSFFFNTAILAMAVNAAMALGS